VFVWCGSVGDGSSVALCLSGVVQWVMVARWHCVCPVWFSGCGTVFVRCGSVDDGSSVALCLSGVVQWMMVARCHRVCLVWFSG